MAAHNEEKPTSSSASGTSMLGDSVDVTDKKDAAQPRCLDELEEAPDAVAPARKTGRVSIADVCGVPVGAEKDRRILWAAAAAVLTVVTIGGTTAMVSAPDVRLWDAERLLAQQQGDANKQDESSVWLADLLAAQRRPSPWSPKLQPPNNDAATKNETPPQKPPAAPPGRARRRASAPVAQRQTPPKTTAAPNAASDDDVDPLYAQRYGSAERIAASSSLVAAIAAPVPKSSKKKINVRGIEVAARLSDEASSDQAGAPVKAVTMEDVQVASTMVPQGAELEGTVTGGSETRVFVVFDLVRLPGGRVVNIDAIARDRSRGTAGIEGHRQITDETVKSVGLRGFGRMVSTGGRALGEAIGVGKLGHVLGEGVEAAADSGGQASQRLDRDQPNQVRVVASQGAPFKLYIRAVRLDDELGES